jgi:hypothetical protein
MNVLLPSLVKRRDPARAGLLIGIYLLSLSAGSILSSLIAIPVYRASGGSARLTLGLWALPAIAAAVAWLPDPVAAASLSAFAQGARYLVATAGPLAVGFLPEPAGHRHHQLRARALRRRARVPRPVASRPVVHRDLRRIPRRVLESLPEGHRVIPHAEALKRHNQMVSTPQARRSHAGTSLLVR